MRSRIDKGKVGIKMEKAVIGKGKLVIEKNIANTRGPMGEMRETNSRKQWFAALLLNGQRDIATRFGRPCKCWWLM